LYPHYETSGFILINENGTETLDSIFHGVNEMKTEADNFIM